MALAYLLGAPRSPACPHALEGRDSAASLFSSVEDGAVAAGAQDVLVQAALAALALRPQRRESALQPVHARQAARVDLDLLQHPCKPQL